MWMDDYCPAPAHTPSCVFSSERVVETTSAQWRCCHNSSFTNPVIIRMRTDFNHRFNAGPSSSQLCRVSMNTELHCTIAFSNSNSAPRHETNL